MAMKTVRLELARSAEFPEGSPNHGYEFVMPLDETGHIDVDRWRENKRACTVKRFWGTEPEENGYLIHDRHRRWAFSYAPGEEDDEPFFHFESHPFREGEYVSLTGHDGKEHTFRIVSIR